MGLSAIEQVSQPLAKRQEPHLINVGLNVGSTGRAGRANGSRKKKSGGSGHSIK